MSEINISSFNIFMVLLFIIGISVTIYQLDQYDGQRKNQQINDTYHAVEKSTYADSLRLLVAVFDTLQEDISNGIADNLNMLVKENKAISYGYIFIKRADSIYKFDRYSHLNFNRRSKKQYHVLSRMPEKEEKIIAKMLPQDKDPVRIIQREYQDIDHLKTIHILHKTETDYAVLMTTKSRY